MSCLVSFGEKEIANVRAPNHNQDHCSQKEVQLSPYENGSQLKVTTAAGGKIISVLLSSDENIFPFSLSLRVNSIVHLPLSSKYFAWIPMTLYLKYLKYLTSMVGRTEFCTGGTSSNRVDRHKIKRLLLIMPEENKEENRLEHCNQESSLFPFSCFISFSLSL